MLCIYHVHTSNVQTHISLYMSKNLTPVGIEPKTSLRVSRCPNHCASSIDAIHHTIILYVYCSTWRLVTYVLRPTSGPAASRASHCRVTGIPCQQPRAALPSQLTRQSLTPAWQCHGLTVGLPAGPSTGSAVRGPARPAWEPHDPHIERF